MTHKIDSNAPAAPSFPALQPERAQPLSEDVERFKQELQQDKGGAEKQGKDGFMPDKQETLADLIAKTRTHQFSKTEMSRAVPGDSGMSESARLTEMPLSAEALQTALATRMGEPPQGGLAMPSSGMEISDQPRIAALTETLVKTILVSDPAHGQDHQVRLVLNDSVLNGTEIHISRSKEGLLSVTISTTDPSSFQTLTAARTDLLECLQKTEPQNVRLTLEDAGTEAEDSSSQRRSRGYEAYKDADKDAE